MSLLTKATTAGFAALGAYSASKDFQSKANTSLQNIETALTLRGTQATIFEQQDKEIQERLGQQLTRADLDTLKAEARLHAAQAETGTSGGTSDLAVAEAYVVGARNREVIIQSAGDQRLALARRNIMSRLDSEMRVARYASDIPSSSEITLGIISQTLSGVQSGMNLGRNVEGYQAETARKKKLAEDNRALTEYQSSNWLDTNNKFMGV